MLVDFLSSSGLELEVHSIELTPITWQTTIAKIQKFAPSRASNQHKIGQRS